MDLREILLRIGGNTRWFTCIRFRECSTEPVQEPELIWGKRGNRPRMKTGTNGLTLVPAGPAIPWSPGIPYRDTNSRLDMFCVL